MRETRKAGEVSSQDLKERESALQTRACVYVGTIQIDVKTIQTEFKDAEYQSADSVCLEWCWTVL